MINNDKKQQKVRSNYYKKSNQISSNNEATEEVCPALKTTPNVKLRNKKK